MAVFDTRISRVKVTASGPPANYTLGAGALDVLTSKPGTTYETTSTSYVNGVTNGLASLAAVDMPAGSTWLVFFQCQAGTYGDATSSQFRPGIQVYANGSIVAATTFRSNENYSINNQPSPVMIEGQPFVGAFEHVANGTSDIHFEVAALTGFRSQFGNSQLVAIRMDGANPLTKSQAGGDYWTAYQALATAVTAATPILSTTFTPNEAGDYLLIACAEEFCDTASDFGFSVQVDGVPVATEYWKDITSNTERFYPFIARKVSLGASQHTITVHGRTTTGAVGFSDTRIILLRLDAFTAWSWVQDTVQSPDYATVTSTYPVFEESCAINHTPYDAEKALVLASGCWRRSDKYSTLMQVRNTTTNQVLGGYTALANRVTPTTDFCSLSCFGVDTLTTPMRYAVDVSGEPGGTASPYSEVLWPTELFVISLDLNTGPAYTLIEPKTNEEITSSIWTEAPGGDLEGPIGGFGNVKIDGITSLTYVPSVGRPPIDFPRLHFYNNDRRQHVLDHVSALGGGSNELGDEWARITGTVASTKYWEMAAKAYITQTSADIATATTLLDTHLHQNSLKYYIYGPKPWPDSGNEYGLRARRLAMTYDMLMALGAMDANLEVRARNCLMGAMYGTINANKSNTGNTLGYGGVAIQPKDAWALNTPSNNHYLGRTYGFAYTITVLWDYIVGKTSTVVFQYNPPAVGDDGSTWDYYSPDAPTTRQFDFTLPLDGDRVHTDAWEFFQRRLETQAFPANGNYPGGFWHDMSADATWEEGSHYGNRASVGAICEIIRILRDANIRDYSSEFTSNIGDTIKSTIYLSTPEVDPSNPVLVTRGDDAQSLSIGDKDRIGILRGVCALYPNGSAETRRAKYWLDTVHADLADTDSESLLDELIFQRFDITPLNYTTEGLPTSAFFGGFGTLASKSDWTTNGVSAWFFSQNWNTTGDDHMHEDSNGLLIYCKGWLLRDAVANKPSGSPYYPLTIDHNTLLLSNLTYNSYPTGQAARNSSSSFVTEPLDGYMGKVARYSWSSAFAYGQGDMQHGYYAKSGSSAPSTKPHNAYNYKRVNDIFTREFFHLKDLNLIVLYDRARLIPPFSTIGTTAQIKGVFQYGTAPSFWDSSTVKVTNAGGGVLYRKFMTTANNVNVVAGTYDGYREEWEWPVAASVNDATKAYGSGMVALQAGLAASLGTMVPTEAVSSTYAQGITVKDPGNYRHIIFAKSEDATYPTSFTYAVHKNSSADVHYVCNLTPGQEYYVTESLVSGTTYQYTVTESFNQAAADSGGVLRFTPGTVYDSFRTTEIIYASGLLGTYDPMITWQNSLTYTGPITGETFSATERIGQNKNDPRIHNIRESNIMSVGADIDEDSPTTVVVSSKGTLSYTPGPNEIPPFREKKIFRGSVAFYPNSTILSYFFYTDPFGQQLHTVLGDEDDSTSVITFPPRNGVSLVPYSEFRVGLDDPAGFNGRITSIVFKARLTQADIGNIGQPELWFSLIRQSPFAAVASAKLSIPFVPEGWPEELTSVAIPVSITTEEMAGCYLSVRPRAKIYRDNYKVAIASVWVETGGKLNEKVISLP